MEEVIWENGKMTEFSRKFELGVSAFCFTPCVIQKKKILKSPAYFSSLGENSVILEGCRLSLRPFRVANSTGVSPPWLVRGLWESASYQLRVGGTWALLRDLAHDCLR